MSGEYQQQYQQFQRDPGQFWLEQSKRIAWFKAPSAPYQNDENNFYHWFADGTLNTCYLALDQHVDAGFGEQTALIYDSPVTNTKQKISYSELQSRVATFAGLMHSLGVGKGDRVVIYMPMIPEAVIGMLACARLGAIHSVVFGGFAPHELAVRIDDAKPKLVLSASCGVEINHVIEYKPLLDEALETAKHHVEHCIIYQREQAKADMQAGRDIDWQSASDAADPIEPVAVNGDDPLYILYTSGTTGTPKGVVRENGGHAVAMHYSMETVYGMKPGEVFWAASDIGWVVGHSYIVYAPLIYRCTTVLYEGKPIRTPDASAFWRVVEEHKVTALFSAPTAFRAIKKEDPTAEGFKKYDTSSLERLFLAGERLDPPTYEWLKEHTGLPVLDHWWQTETGWAIACNPIGIEQLGTKPGSSTVPTPGFDVQILDMNGERCAPNENGAVVIKLPLPPGCLPTIWQNDARFKAGYLSEYPGYYLSGDGGYIDDDGYLFIMGRTDDVINVAGHRLSTGEMEEIVAAHPAVAECAVFGVSDSLKGQLPMAMIVLKDDYLGDSKEVEKELIHAVRHQIGAIACLKNILHVERLPKTRSGKILRKNLRQLVDGEELNIPSTIDDASIFDEINQQLNNR
ncbi:propionyl-CoA synthetase [Pseudoalteromonas lipolytica]|uniref:Propionyl-CoA synthetase n=2 Tax=Pseudoalteromonas TaxID=53246 RepID=A0AAD0WCW7_9GAMM|nr:propionyl-CoA synthetase [Pseudoalteromonas donghaensis]AXV65857.1 propionyl-CoA synthetase [Pseudoalteromonas donghaensis]QPL42028.1 propionyl-CoA synthetase [Pseudoalteromonas sp. A41-2]